MIDKVATAFHVGTGNGMMHSGSRSEFIELGAVNPYKVNFSVPVPDVFTLVGFLTLPIVVNDQRRLIVSGELLRGTAGVVVDRWAFSAGDRLALKTPICVNSNEIAALLLRVNWIESAHLAFHVVAYGWVEQRVGAP